MQIVITIDDKDYNDIITDSLRNLNHYERLIANGQPLPEDCEILTKEAYADLCMRASKGAEHWIDDADHYICPVCGFIVANPNHFIGRRCPNCGFQDKKDKEVEGGNDNS